MSWFKCEYDQALGTRRFEFIVTDDELASIRLDGVERAVLEMDQNRPEDAARSLEIVMRRLRERNER